MRCHPRFRGTQRKVLADHSLPSAFLFRYKLAGERVPVYWQISNSQIQRMDFTIQCSKISSAVSWWEELSCKFPEVHDPSNAHLLKWRTRIRPLKRLAWTPSLSNWCLPFSPLKRDKLSPPPPWYPNSCRFLAGAGFLGLVVPSQIWDHV